VTREPADLTARVERLEQEVQALRERMGASRRSPTSLLPPPPVQEAAPRRRHVADLETDLVRTWFARLGALAILLGAGFAFKYGIDRGLIGPLQRVVVGLVAGAVFLLGGEAARRRRWGELAQAVTGGGVALLYLSVLAALILYGILAPGSALILLTAVSALGVVLALRHDSQALALVGLIGGFMNAALLGSEIARPLDVFVYLTALDAGVLWLAYAKSWRATRVFALAGTAIIFALNLGSAGIAVGLVFATALWVIFVLIPFVTVAGGRTLHPQGDISVMVTSGLAYLAAALTLLDRNHSEWQGLFTLGLGVVYAALALIARKSAAKDGPLPISMAGLAAAFVTLAAPVQLEAAGVGVAWAIEGALLTWLGSRFEATRIRATGLLVASLAFLNQLAVVADVYRPARLLLTGASASLVVTIACLYGVAFIYGRTKRGHELERFAAPGACAAAGILTLAWLGAEATEYFRRLHPPHGDTQDIELAISAIWGIYAVALLRVGVSGRRWARLFGIVVFAATILKIAAVDVWLLDELYRTLAFMGLGALLLTCSLMYNRLATLVRQDDQTSKAKGDKL